MSVLNESPEVKAARGAWAEWITDLDSKGRDYSAAVAPSFRAAVEHMGAVLAALDASRRDADYLRSVVRELPQCPACDGLGELGDRWMEHDMYGNAVECDDRRQCEECRGTGADLGAVHRAAAPRSAP